eukprot:TRINITY_DN6777_c0_g1_i1.p2 TRINITY_DN6777_c0_g1~~TRINITY_DN6777_c0_g1_i1.p2  ORF type:complete len:173 (-),score=18.21 TRINITY_DN6777_c0_g1_i1:168-686(-)
MLLNSKIYQYSLTSGVTISKIKYSKNSRLYSESTKKKWVTMERPIEWAQLDAFLHVNNKVFFGWFEIARIEYMQRLGMVPSVKAVPSVILAETSCKFLKPANFPDQVLIKVRTKSIGNTSWITEFEVESMTLNNVICQGEARCVFYDYEKNCKVSVPEDIRQKIQQIENEDI